MTYIINGPIGNKGGVETFNKYLYNDLKEQNKKVYKLYIFKKPQNYDSIHLFELLKQKDFVIISSLYYGLLHLLLKKHKKIQILHGFKPFIFKWSLKNIFIDPIKSLLSFFTIIISAKKANYIVANSYLTKGFYKRMFNINSDVIGLFFKSSLPQTTLFENKFTYDITFVGHLSKMKNPYLLIEIAKKIQEKYHFSPTLCFIGNGIEMENLKNTAKKNNINATFLGHIEHDKVLKTIAASKICILPTDLEPFGLVVAESLSTGTHTFTSKYCGITDFINFSNLHILNDNYIEVIKNILQSNYEKKPLIEEYKNFVLQNLFIENLQKLIDDK